MDESRFEKIDHKSEYRLPASYNREIGRVVVRWAYFEHHVQALIWAIAFASDGKGAALGRLSIVEQRFPERISLLEQLAIVRRHKFSATILKTIHKRSGTLCKERNLLAHGCWTNHPAHGWLVRETKGGWSKSKTGPKGSRKVMPQSKRRDSTMIAQTVLDIEGLIEELSAFQSSID